MKKIGIIILVIAVMTACDSAGEKKAQLRLEAAQAALSQENFSEAKLQIDSIKILFPKAFEARRQGIKLMQQVEYKEQIKTLAFLDSMLQIRQQEFEDIKGRFVMEKDAEYQDIGIYFYPTQTVEKNLNRSFLRAQVNEQGVMYLTSIYCGGYAIKHKAVKVTAPDATFAETPLSTDVYESKDLGIITEKADYKLGEDGDVIKFITLNKDNKLQVEYLGGKKYVTTMSANDKKAIAELFTLSEILSSIEEIKRETKESNLKIEFIKRKMEEEKE